MPRGDLGRSLRSNRPVAVDLARVVPLTLMLALAAMAMVQWVVPDAPRKPLIAKLRGQTLLNAVPVAVVPVTGRWTGSPIHRPN